MASDKVQVVFMVDTNLPKSAARSLEQYYRSLCLAAVRILLYLSQFPIREHLSRVVWNFKLFNSERAGKTTKTWQFHENRSELIEKFFQELHENLEPSESAAAQSRHNRLKNATQKPVRLVYNALAAVVQDFIWDAPEIMSPVRPRKRGRGARTKAATSSMSLKVEETNHDKNLIIILSSCPASDEETRKFCHGPLISEEASCEVPVTMTMIVEQLLPPALLTQLSSKGIAVHWVHTGAHTETGNFTQKVPPGLSLMSSVLKKAGGTMIPLSTLVTPLAPQLKIQCSSVAPQLPPNSLTSAENQGATERRINVCHGSANVVSLSCNADSPVDTRSVSSVDSEMMHPPSIPKVRLSTVPLKELLSSLVLPPPAVLKEYLRPRREYSGGRDRGVCDDVIDGPLALKENNLHWFSTRDGKVLFIVELHPVCRLLTPNLSKACTTASAGAYNTARSSTERGGYHGQVRERRSSGTAASSRSLLRKKLSFSRVLKSNSESSSCQAATRARVPEADSQSILENSIPHSTFIPHSHNQHPSVISTPSPPSMVAVGLVRQSDLPLSWLDPTSVYSCNGLYVPRETRNNVCHSFGRESKSSHLDHSDLIREKSATDLPDEDKNPAEPSRGYSTISPPCVSTSISFPPCTLTSTTLPPHTLTSPSYYLGLNISAVVRMDKFSIPGSSRRQLSATNRKRRTASVPKDIVCSLVRENKENKTTIQAKKLTKIKSSHSLPSSPVVLCTKLPLMKLQDCSQLTQIVTKSPSLSVAVSPKQLQLKISKAQDSSGGVTLNASTCSGIPPANQYLHPKESLLMSGRYCSRQYLNLCVWLAKNGLLLVVKIVLEGGGSCLGVLQPVTSLVSTLSLFKSHYHNQLLKKLVDPPLSSESSLTNTRQKIVSVPLKPKKQLSSRGEKQCSKAMNVLQTVVPQPAQRQKSGASYGSEPEDEKLGGPLKDGVREREASSVEGSESCSGHQENSFVASYASDCELYTGLQLLLREKSDKCLPTDCIQSCLLSALADAPPFTHLPLLPWFPYTQRCSITHHDIERLQELQLDIKDGEYSEVQRKSQLLAALKELYSCGQVAQKAGSLEREDSDPPPLVQDEQLDQPIQGEVESECCTLPSVSSTEDLCEWFLSQYEEQVKMCPDGDSLLRWSTKTLGQFQACFNQLLASSEITSEEERQSSLWEQLQDKVLLSNVQLGEKYERIVRDKMEEGEAAGGEKEGGGGESSVQKRKITEYLLQILLHFEALKLCPTIEPGIKKAAANTLVVLFRRLSLLANPGLVGSCLKKIILPIYLDSCQEVLTEVYNQLMLPLPSDLSSSPDRPLSPEQSATEGEGEEGGSSEEWTPLLSLEERPAAPKLAELGVKRLARHMSFHDNQSHRQITVLNKTKRRRKRHKAKQKLEASSAPRRSPRIAKLTDHNAQKGRGVCRSLFSRSMSVSCDIGTKRKRGREEGEGMDTENHITKRRKGLHALQRHHTVVEGAPDNRSLRSPRKSFYSGANVPRQVTTPLFKTPPLKESHSKVHSMLSPRVLLNKEPSPAAIYSLLHGQMVLPHDQQDSSGPVRTPCKSTKDVSVVAAATALTVSPRVRGLERTPESKGQSRDLSFTPLGHRGSSSLVPPRDLSLMLSPGVLASYMMSNTPSSLARSVERGQTQLATSQCAETASTTAGGVRKSGIKSARTLTYENEDPLLKNGGRSSTISCPSSPSKAASYSQPSDAITEYKTSTITASSQPTIHVTEVEESGLQRSLNSGPNCPCLSRVHCSSSDRDNEIFLISPSISGDMDPSPPSTAGVHACGSGASGVCLLTDLDPSIENESASMMAFKLSTPTKDDPRDFLDAFIN